jgi:hypothetical protein
VAVAVAVGEDSVGEAVIREVVSSMFVVGRVLSMVVEGPTRCSVRGGEVDGVVDVLVR